MDAEGAASSSSNVTELMGRLKLTAEESDALDVDDIALEGWATSDRAIIGKVLSSSVLHIQTIMAALRPAWGNPRGLEFKSVDDNIFIAEFGSKQDLDRALDGSPWNVGKKTVLVQQFDANLRPSEVVFNKMAIWIRIYDLPFGLMNSKWGWELAKKLGSVMKVEVDAQGRAWGSYLRAKVQVDISKPLLRCITIFSQKRQTTEQYKVRYEKLPNYCYSCGIIGHSSLECPTPAERDEDGLLPYGKNLRAFDDNKLKKGTEDKQSSSAGRSFNSTGQRGSSEGQEEQQGAGSKGNTSGSANLDNKEKSSHEDENVSLLKRQTRTCKKNLMEDEKMIIGKELFLCLTRGQGTKRKQVRTSRPRPVNVNQGEGMDSKQDAMELIVASPSKQLITARAQLNTEIEVDEADDEAAKKIRKINDSYTGGSAEAARQPRREP
ncbi:unnamed protein product [Urochloa humidicola]